MVNTQPTMYETVCPHCYQGGTSYLLLSHRGQEVWSEKGYVFQSCLACLKRGKERAESEKSLLNADPCWDSDIEVEQLWLKLQTVPFCEEQETLLEPFHIWNIGTNKHDIWLWFDQTHTGGLSYFLHHFSPVTEILASELRGTLLNAHGIPIECINSHQLLVRAKEVMTLWRRVYEQTDFESISKDSLLFDLVTPESQLLRTLYKNGYKKDDTLLFRVARKKNIDAEQIQISHTDIRLAPLITETELSFSFEISHTCSIEHLEHRESYNVHQEIIATYPLHHVHSVLVHFYLEVNTNDNSMIPPLEITARNKKIPLSCYRNIPFQRGVFAHILSLVMEQEEMKEVMPLLKRVFLLRDWDYLGRLENELLPLGVAKDTFEHILFVTSMDDMEYARWHMGEMEELDVPEQKIHVPFDTFHTPNGHLGQCLPQQGVIFLNIGAMPEGDEGAKVFWRTLFYNLHLLQRGEKNGFTSLSEEECEAFMNRMYEAVKGQFHQVF